MELWRWKQINELGNRTFFSGQGASFCVTAVAESMRSMIYFPTFQMEFSFDLVAYSVAVAIDTDLCTKPNAGHPALVWIEPTKDFLFGLNNITGKICLLKPRMPVPLIWFKGSRGFDPCRLLSLYI